MALIRMDNVDINVEDLDAAIAFFTELGMHLDGRMDIEGDWAGRIIGLPGTRTEIAMMRTPDGHGALELTKFHTPAAVSNGTQMPNTLGIGRIMFAVGDIEDTVARLTELGGSLVGEIVQYEDVYRLGFLRGPEGVIIGLAEQLS